MQAFSSGDALLPQLALAFFVALGMVMGGSLGSGLATLFFSRFPATAMLKMAQDLKLWATVAALGGTLSTLRTLEGGLFAGQPGVVARQVVHILAAFAGAHLGAVIINAMLRGARGG